MYIMIVNPAAGNGKAMNLFRRIQKEPLYKKENCRSFLTQEPGHAERLALQVTKIHRETLKGIIVLGGDGTLHEVVNGIRHYSETPVCFIPAGSGNDFARGLTLKKGGLKLFRSYVRNPKKKKVLLSDYILNQRQKQGRRTFINSIGFGLDGLVVAAANQPKYRSWTRKFHITKLTYPFALLQSISKAKPIHFELFLDGKQININQAMMVTITNHSYYGGGMRIAPKAKINSKGLSILVVKPISKKKLLAMFVSVFFGLHTRMKEVEEWRASTVHISSEQPLPFQVDGQSGSCFDCSIKKAETSTTFYSD
ncbi:diacylglycerol kinase family protein [Halobacillus sp. Nhm2S1]|uniref:diacylglycerol/lipid kinase family protein n=1 Tax=Halobacillus sp. Nhm2S1 TaxID=2866716 RepID=UPI001C72A59F|nr:diacylglycerol kinase family protein [Halobacillus sp. Nhm2S1]MBX0359084.1 diacylglycerol kinase family lipid kinase [Halobacillus sp. Nhm2S1]